MVVGEDLHQHLELGNKRDGFEGQPAIGDLLLRIGGLKFSPGLLSLILLCVQESGYLHVALASRIRFHETQCVQQKAMRTLTIAEPNEATILDIVDLATDRTKVGPEGLLHQGGIGGDLELGKCGIGQKRDNAHESSSASYRPSLRSWSWRQCWFWANTAPAPKKSISPCFNPMPYVVKAVGLLASSKP